MSSNLKIVPEDTNPVVNINNTQSSDHNLLITHEKSIPEEQEHVDADDEFDHDKNEHNLDGGGNEEREMIQQSPLMNKKPQFTLNHNKHKHKTQNEQSEHEPSFGMFLNPDKNRGGFDNRSNASNYSEEYESDEEEDDDDDVSAVSSVESRRSRRSRRSKQSTSSAIRKREKERVLFRKKELLQQIREFKERGYKVYSEYTLKSSSEELEHEVKLARKYFNDKSLQSLAERGLFCLIKMIEVGTKVYNPLGAKFDGLSDAVFIQKESISYEIHAIVEKYFGEEGGSFPPEINLALIILGAMVSCHFSNHFMSNITKTITSPEALNQMKPDVLSTIMSNIGPALSSFMNTGSQQPQQQTQPQPSNQTNSNHSPFVSQQQMKPPETSSDLNDLFSRLMPNQPSQPRPNPAPSVNNQNVNNNIPNHFNVMPNPQTTRQSVNKPNKRKIIEYSDSDATSVFSDAGSDTNTVKEESKKIPLTKQKPFRRQKKGLNKKTFDIF